VGKSTILLPERRKGETQIRPGPGIQQSSSTPASARSGPHTRKVIFAPVTRWNSALKPS